MIFFGLNDGLHKIWGASWAFKIVATRRKDQFCFRQGWDSHYVLTCKKLWCHGEYAHITLHLFSRKYIHTILQSSLLSLFVWAYFVCIFVVMSRRLDLYRQSVSSRQPTEAAEYILDKQSRKAEKRWSSGEGIGQETKRDTWRSWKREKYKRNLRLKTQRYNF
jgi:hypothetical protein